MVRMKFTRREFLASIGWGAMVLAAGAVAGAFARFMQPNIVTPALGPVEIGTANAYPTGILTFVEKAQVYVGRDRGGLYAIVAQCTHLGCTPHLDVETFVCPCHGSRFSTDGQVVNGPASRPLDRVMVGRATDGKLFVDRSRLVDTNYRLPV